MKHLTLVRHAKAASGSPGQDDFQRPLNERGLRDSVTMAQRLLAHDLAPQHIVSSPALRAVTTAQIFADTLGMPSSSLTTDRTIYEASSAALYDVVWGVSDDYRSIMLVGHNPGLSDLLCLLSAQTFADLATCAVVILQFDCQGWHQVDPYTARVRLNDFPSNKSGSTPADSGGAMA